MSRHVSSPASLDGHNPASIPPAADPLPPENPPPIAGEQIEPTVGEIYSDHFQKKNWKPKGIECYLGHWERLTGNPPANAIDTECFAKFREQGHEAGLSGSFLEAAIRGVMQLLRFANKHGLISEIPEVPPRRCRGRKKPAPKPQPEVIQSEVIQSEVIQPEVIQPEVIQPEVIQPEVIQSKVIWGPVDGIPPFQGTPPQTSKLPVSIDELERIIGAARTMPDPVDGIPGHLWWPALVMTIVDTGQYAPVVLALPTHAYKRETGTLVVAGRIHPLHTHTANALEAIRHHERTRLFPWSRDGGKPPYFMLYHHYRNLLHRAGLSPHQKEPMINLRSMAVEAPNVLDCIDPYRPFHPVQGHPQRKPKKPRRAKPPKRNDGVYQIRNDSPDTLRHYFLNVYKPLRLIGGSARTDESYFTTINAFSSFFACDATVHHLNDEHVDQFKAWIAQRLAPVTVNNHLRHLLALWRHAWRKRKVEEQPRDVEFLRTAKPIPEAWTQEEMGRLLTAASQTAGEVRGIAARLWWPALFLLLYDTGLRLNACMMLRSEDLNLGDGMILARAETQKQKADQVFRVHIDTLEALRAICPERRLLVFNYENHRSDKTTFYRRFNEILKRAGLPSGGRDKFHKIRRTSATFLADATGTESAMRHLGHSAPSMTARYLDVSKIRHQVSAADQMERPPWTPADDMRFARRFGAMENPGRFDHAALTMLSAPGVPPEALQEAIRRSANGEFISREIACEIVARY